MHEETLMQGYILTRRGKLYSCRAARCWSLLLTAYMHIDIVCFGTINKLIIAGLSSWSSPFSFYLSFPGCWKLTLQLIKSLNNPCSLLSFFIYRPFNSVGLAAGDHAGSVHDSVALSEVSPPHVLVGDLYDVSRGEPALLTVRQADTFIQAWEK